MANTDHQESPAAQTDEQPPCPEAIPENGGPDTDEAARNSKTEEYPAVNMVEQSMLRWTRVVGIFTAVLAIVGGFQGWAFVQSERAFLYFRVQGIIPFPLKSNTPISVGVSVTNTGRSQAFITDEKINIAEYYRLPPTPTFAVSHYLAKGPIPAGQTASILIGPLAYRMAQSHVSAIQKGEFKLYVFGYAKYTDEFSLFGSRTIGFCEVYNPVDPTGTPGARFDGCDNPHYVYSQ